MVANSKTAKNNEDIAGLQISSDNLGVYVAVSIDTAIFRRVAVMKTAYWYTDQCYVFVAKGDAPDSLKIELRAKEPAETDFLESLARAFCNRLLDQQVREMIAIETGEIRDALVKKAFFEGSKHLDPTILQSNESAVPSPGQSYKDDPLGVE